MAVWSGAWRGSQVRKPRTRRKWGCWKRFLSTWRPDHSSNHRRAWNERHCTSSWGTSSYPNEWLRKCWANSCRGFSSSHKARRSRFVTPWAHGWPPAIESSYCRTSDRMWKSVPQIRCPPSWRGHQRRAIPSLWLRQPRVRTFPYGCTPGIFSPWQLDPWPDPAAIKQYCDFTSRGIKKWYHSEEEYEQLATAWPDNTDKRRRICW